MKYFPAPKRNAKRALVFTRRDFLHSLRVASITRQAERNQLLIWGCGLRVTELSQITVADVMFSSGAIRDELALRAIITKRNKARSVPLTNPLLRKHLEEYLEYRINNGIGTELETKPYRGLTPHLALIYSDRNTPFQLSLKVRRSKSGEIERYWASDTLERTFAKLYASSGLIGATSHSGRRSYANRIMEATGDIELVARLLGHESIDQTAAYLDFNRKAAKSALIMFFDDID